MGFFKPKRKQNRRFVRKHVLDVKLRSSQRRQTRLRRVALGLIALASVFFGLVAAWRGGEWALRRLVYENPSFAIHKLEVQTDGVITLDQLRRWAGVRLDDNLLALDLARVKRDLEMVPNIQSVAIERVLPHTLRIRVVEREPIAQFNFPQLRAGGVYGRGVYLLDAEGYVMTPLEPHQRSAPPAPGEEHLPVLVGIPVSELRPGRQVESPQARAALRLIEAFGRSPMAGLVDLKLIDLKDPAILQVMTGQSSELVFGLHDLDRQLRRWRMVYDYGQQTGQHLEWLDLSVANNVPSRWQEASLVTPALPKPIKPSRKKKNV